MAFSPETGSAVASRLKEWREGTANLSRLDLSRRLNVSKTAVSNWELGLNEPSERVYRELANMAEGQMREWFLAKAGLSDRELAVLMSGGSPRARLTKEDKALDPELLASVLEAVEAAANRAGIILPRMKYAEILAQVYDSWREKEQHDSTIVDKLVNHVCSPSNRKVRK